jgi:hypothetical protein
MVFSTLLVSQQLLAVSYVEVLAGEMAALVEDDEGGHSWYL